VGGSERSVEQSVWSETPLRERFRFEAVLDAARVYSTESAARKTDQVVLGAVPTAARGTGPDATQDCRLGRVGGLYPQWSGAKRACSD
jgi:hypothetical protein